MCVRGRSGHKSGSSGAARKAADMRALCLLVAATALVAARNSSAAPVDGSTRVHGGSPAQPGQFPHHAVMVVDLRIVCSGSLITTTAVLTAAHCTVGFKSFTVVLGLLDLSEPDSAIWVSDTPMAVAYPDYHVTEIGRQDYDVAVAFLPNPVTLNMYIQLVKLPSSWEVNNSYVGPDNHFSGWGYTTAPLEKPSTRLQWIEMVVLRNDICQTFLGPYEMMEYHMCAISIFSSPCHCNSGGALVVKDGGRYKQIGVASFAKDGCATNKPTVFARVTSVIKWIRMITESTM